ncbi:MAG TPA: TetR family transcriptional regulator C-terminal domain-containing protein [Candidatus Sulfomarinibacteraceae bacterium]|nr:TetR family transcriptional regulator C-terminal domain-containing protein [Candidatus Sulfomarinibacteraceae bacterium]
MTVETLEDAPSAAEVRRAQQRERILAAAEQLLVTHGVERSRLRDVAEVAGVSVGTVQHYFDTRDRLVAELFEWSSTRRLDAWLAAAATAGDPWTRLTALLDASLADPAIRHSRIWVEFIAMARVEALREKLGRYYAAWRPPLRAIIEEGVAAGIFHPTRPIDDIVAVFIVFTDGAEVAIALEAPGVTPDGFRRLQVDLARSLLGVETPRG